MGTADTMLFIRQIEQSSLILDENHDLITGKDYYDNTMSFEDYYNRFMNYYNDLMSAPEQAKDALNALNAAKAET